MKTGIRPATVSLKYGHLEPEEFIQFRLHSVTPTKPMSWMSVVASLLFHLVSGFAFLFLLSAIPKLQTPDDKSITVHIFVSNDTQQVQETPIVSDEIAPVIKTPLVSSDIISKPKTEELPREDEQAKVLPKMITASQFYSERILALPKNKKIRQALNKLSTEEHMIQLCNMEAMEQVHRSNASLQPDYLVAYAMADPKMLPSVIDASGAAFRSKSRWYNIEYTCSVTPEVSKVIEFAFQIGTEISKEKWRQHNLTANDGPDE